MSAETRACFDRVAPHQLRRAGFRAKKTSSPGATFFPRRWSDAVVMCSEHPVWTRAISIGLSIRTTRISLPHPADLTRRANSVDKCFHRYGDSRTRIDGVEAAPINDFRSPAENTQLCLWEQYQLYLEPSWTPEKAEAWYSCFAQSTRTLGHWEFDGISPL